VTVLRGRGPALLAVTLLAVIVLAVAACGSGVVTSGGANVDEHAGEGGVDRREPQATSGPGRSGGGGGAPIGLPPGGAVGSPIKIPALEQAGNPPSVIANAVEPEVRAQCGGSLCMRLRYVDEGGRSLSTDEQDPVAKGCRWVPGGQGQVPLRTELEVAPGSEVTFGFACGAGGDSSGGEGEGETDGDGSSDGGDGEPSGTSAPTDDELPATEQ
jgi:hypothetical protein